MKKALLGIVVAGIASTAAAQSAVYSWNVVYGTLTTAPTASAAGVFSAIAGSNAIGELGATHARIRVSLNLAGITMNNINTATAGTVVGGGQASGLFYTAFDLLAANAGNNSGTFSAGWVRNGGLRPTSNSGILSGAGSINGVAAVQLAQQPGLSQPGNQNTTFTDFWEIFYSTPANRNATETWSVGVPAFAGGVATQLIVNTDADPENNFTPGFANLATSYASPVSVNVVIPAPASLALLGLGGLVAGRRRR